MIGACPACGLQADDHAPDVFADHTITFLADPDRTATDALEWITGVLFGLHLALVSGIPTKHVSGTAETLAGVCIETVTRRRSIGTP